MAELVVKPTETLDDTGLSRLDDGENIAAPGVIVVFSKSEPLSAPIRLVDSSVVLGRGSMPAIQLSDHRMSRRHFRVSKSGEKWCVEDLNSRNGTTVDGTPIDASREGTALQVVRAGDTLFVLSEDVRPFEGHYVDLGQPWVLGPKMRLVLEQIRRSATVGTLHITGETGSGKELAARSFHAFGPSPNGPFVAVNCAAIPEGVAERLLFGARKGAYSGATADASGYVQEADGGTLFLDEVGELDLNVQAKLLRFIETREALPLGASRAAKLDVRVCSATHRDLRRAVKKGTFREDLYYRMARPHVSLPPLRERIEDIPHLLDRKLREINGQLLAHASFVEACLLRPWPGNIRELTMETQDAASLALSSGNMVRSQHLADSAGFPPPSSHVETAAPVEVSTARESDLDHGSVVEMLKRCDGRVATAARELGVHRNQLRRWLEKNGLDPKTLS